MKKKKISNTFSTSITNHQFWIRTEDGEEQPIHLRGVDIPLRVGQKITLISASRKGAKDGWISILVNHSAGRHWFVKNAIGLNRQLSIDVFTGKSIIIAGVLGFALFYVTTNYTSDASVFVQMAMDWLSHAGLHYVWHLRVETVMNAMPFVIPGIYLIYRGFTKVVRSIILHKRLQSHLNKLAQSVYTDTEST